MCECASVYTCVFSYKSVCVSVSERVIECASAAMNAFSLDAFDETATNYSSCIKEASEMKNCHFLPKKRKF